MWGKKKEGEWARKERKREEWGKKERHRQDCVTCTFLGNASLFFEKTLFGSQCIFLPDMDKHRKYVRHNTLIPSHKKFKLEKCWKEGAAYYPSPPSASKIPNIYKLNPSFSMELVRTACAFPWSSHKD